jgi:two-component system chemotaxis sensor kinase CheA
MNEFIEQFLIECRELVTQATDDLLALEEQGDDRERLDSAFRAFHTLKGAAGIVDFDAMGRALHAAEDVLAAVRSNAGQVTSQLIGDGLTCLDQVSQWLDAMQVDGEMPPGADAQADAVVRRFGRTIEARDPKADAAAALDWAGDLQRKHPHARAQAQAALRYAPDAEAFFRNEDPLAILSELPGLLVLKIEPPPSQALETFDPFVCQLVLTALFSVAPDVLEALLVGKVGAEVVALSAAPDSSLPPVARNLIEAQVLLLADTDAEAAAPQMCCEAWGDWRRLNSWALSGATAPRPPSRRSWRGVSKRRGRLKPSRRGLPTRPRRAPFAWMWSGSTPW